jgi:alpha-tubulin suppressor-like RCC1 family protein
VKNVSAGGYHTGFVDDIGRLFTCGKNDKGQLGLGSFNNELTPYYVS